MVADQVIEETAGSKIKDGDIILTYARYVLALSQYIRLSLMLLQFIRCRKGTAWGSLRRTPIFGGRSRLETHVGR
jgi:hypothetical protein